jgi:hypothetical protein
MIRSFTLIFVLFFCKAQSQVSLTLEPNPVSITVLSTDIDIAAKAIIKNTSEFKKNVQWIRLVDNISQGWESAICDKNACYISTLDTMSLELEGGEESNMDVHIYPNGNNGEAKIKVKVVEIGNDSNSVTGTYLFNLTSPVRNITLPEIKVFPNPTQDFFRVRSNITIGKIELYNVVGRKIKTYYAYPEKQYSVDGLNAGLYLARLFSLDEKVIKTSKLRIY